MVIADPSHPPFLETPMLAPDKLWSAGDPPREAHHTDDVHLAPTGQAPPTVPPFADPPPARPRRRRGPFVATALIAALAAGGTVYGLENGDGSAGSTRETASLPASASPLPGLRKSGNSVRDIYRAASPAVVSIRAAGSGGQGTGFLVDGEGTVVTNAHVVGDGTRAQVQFGDDGRTATGRIVGSDPSTDLAVVKVEASAVRDVQPLTIADSASVQVGDEAVAIGNPFGLDRTATAGIISALEREITAPNGFSIDEVIQTDAPINPGNSGGPLLNTRGQVIGVNSQIQSSGGGNVGIGFAVPSNTVRDVIPRLQRGETIKRAWLGVSTSPAASGAGARVESAQPGSPAAEAGLRSGDVITRVDGEAVGEPEDIAAAIQDARPGQSVSVEVQRDRGSRSVDVELGTRPANSGR